MIPRTEPVQKPIRIVMLGSFGSGKSEFGNLILDNLEFDTGHTTGALTTIAVERNGTFLG